MKTLMMIAGLLLISVTMNAQDNAGQTTYPYWTISKDVQKIQFKNVSYVPSTAVTGTNSMVVSKGVHAGQPASVVTGRVDKSGTPAWVVSKGVARQRMEK